MKLIWSQRATADLEQIGDFISRDQPERARRYVQTLVDRAKQAIQFPQSGRIVPEFNDENVREFIEGNYRIVYEILEIQKTIVVMTVFEAHRLIEKKLRKK
jgi:toxin ParE1/3/4